MLKHWYSPASVFLDTVITSVYQVPLLHICINITYFSCLLFISQHDSLSALFVAVSIFNYYFLLQAVNLKQLQICCQYWLGYSAELEGKTIVEETLYSNHNSWRNKSSTHLEVLSLLSSFVLNFAKEANQLQSLWAMNSAIYSNDWFGLVWPPV